MSHYPRPSPKSPQSITSNIPSALLALLLAACTLPATGQMAATSNGKFLGNTLKSTTTPDADFDNYWNQVTPENSGKWESVEATRDVMNWTNLDYIYNFTRARGIPFKQHTFVWGQQYPAWITTLTQAEQREEVEEWIAAFAARYPDTEFIDVVNEPLPGHAPPPYAAALGGAGATGWDWVIWAFEKARLHCPNAKLLLNDYSILSSDSATTNYLTIINLLKDRGLIDGIGEQAHFYESTSITTIQNNLTRLAATGLPIYISELDINLADDTAQLNRYQTLFPVLWTNPAVRGITFWGYKEGAIWRTDGYLLRSDGSERPALTWMEEYVAANPQTLNVSVTTPANGQGFAVGSPVSAVATVGYGTEPFTVTFQKKLSTETEFTTIGSDNTAPYTAELGVLPLGTYQIRAIVTDNVSATATSATNTFAVTPTPTSLSWDGGTTDIAGTGDGSSGGGDGTWDTTIRNWDQENGLAHVAWNNSNNYTAVFSGTAGTISLGTGVTVGGLIFASAYTVNGNTVTFGSSGTISNSAAVTIASSLAGTGPITKAGAGTLKLTGANTFTGGLTVNAGTVFVNAASNVNALSGGKVTIGDSNNTGASAELLYSGTNGNNSFSNLIDVRGTGTTSIRVVGYNPTFSGGVNLGNNLNVVSNNNGGSTIGFSGGVTGTGNLVIQSNAANGSNSSAITFSGSALNFTGTITNSGTTTSATASNTTISAVIGTSVTGITQNSTNSALILTGANTFTGNIEISAGTLSANRSSSSANPTSGALGNAQTAGRTVTVGTGGTLSFDLGDVMGNGASTPNLTLIVNGGTLRNKAASNFFNILGPVQLNGGTLSSFGGGSAAFPSFALTGTVTIGGSAVSTISNTGTNSQIGLQNAGTTFDVADAASGSDLNVTGVLTGWNSGSGSLIKTGAGTMTLSGTNTYTGATRVDNGTLAFGASGLIATSSSVTIKAGATLDTSAKTTYAIPSTQPVTFGIDATGSGSCGKIAAAALNVSNAVVTYNITGTPDDPVYVLATYTTGQLTGTFASAPSTPVGYTLDYAYQGNKIALVQSVTNTTPTISDITSQSVPSGGNTGALAFTITDEDVNSVTPSGSSSNPTLVPNGNISFGGSGANRTVTVTPVSGLSGTATITITVTDNGSLTAQDTFTLTVTDNYLSWATTDNVTGGENGDSDNDGVQNLVEYALVNGGENGVFSANTITFTKRGAPYGSDLTYTIETSETLSDPWTPAVTHGPELLGTNPTISHTFTPGSPVKNFARLKVSIP